MSSQLLRIKMLLGLAILALAFAQGVATAQQRGPSLLQIGTVITMEGYQEIGGQWIPFEQYMKCSGRLILPETQANMYYFLEYWGRDGGTMVMRMAANGDMLYYSRGHEVKMFVNGPVGTFWEMTDPEFGGQTIRAKIVAKGITLELPTGAVYTDVVRMNLYCMTCGPEPVLLESHWLSPEVGFEVLIKQEQDPPFWEWLVSVTRK